MAYSIEELSESIDLIETILIEHIKCLIEISKQFDFITEQLLRHRMIEFKKPPRNMSALVAQLEPIDGMARYTLDAVNRLLPLLEKNKKTSKYD